MRIYVSYQFKGSDKVGLRESLEAVSKTLSAAGHEPFVFYREVMAWGKKKFSSRKIINEAFLALDKCDAVLAVVESEQVSEGMMLEIGYAKALGKQLVLAINEKLEKDFLRFVRELVDEVIEYKNLADLDKKFKLVKL